MRKLLLNIACLFIVSGQILSCQTIKKMTIEEDSFIPYLLPYDTEQAIYSKIKQLESESLLLGFTFQFTSNGAINIYLNKFQNGYDRDHKLSNVFVNDIFYPLTFELDDTFFAESKGGYPVWNVSREDPKNKRNDIITEEKIQSLDKRKTLRAVYKKDTL